MTAKTKWLRVRGNLTAKLYGLEVWVQNWCSDGSSSWQVHFGERCIADGNAQSEKMAQARAEMFVRRLRGVIFDASLREMR